MASAAGSGDAFRLSARPAPPWTCLLGFCPASLAGGQVAAEAADTWTPSPYPAGEVSKLGLAEWSDRDGLVYVPRTYQCNVASPVVVVLHGEGGDADAALTQLLPFADQYRLLLAAPESRGNTWSMASGLLNEDVAFIDKSLETLFNNYSAEENRIGLAGFEHGASFALDLGVRNGPLFSHIMAFSPTEADPPCYEDGPEIFVAYARNEIQLGSATITGGSARGARGTPAAPSAGPAKAGPVRKLGRANSWSCPSLRVVPRLKRCGYKCRVHEFSPVTCIPEEGDAEAEGEGEAVGKGQGPSGAEKTGAKSKPKGAVGTPTDVIAHAVDWFAKNHGGLSTPDGGLGVFEKHRRGRGLMCPLKDLQFPASWSCKV